MLLLKINGGNHNLDGIADIKLVLGLVNSLVRNLRNVNKTLDVRNNLSESTECRKRNNLYVDNRAYGVISLENLPRAVLYLLISKRNLLVLHIKILNINLDNIAGFYNLRRVLDSVPGKLRLMYKSFNAADIDERAEIGKILNGTCVLLTYLGLCPESLLLSLEYFTRYGVDRTYNSSSSLIDVNYSELNFLVKKIGKIASS